MNNADTASGGKTCCRTSAFCHLDLALCFAWINKQAETMPKVHDE